ncbi:MAG: hypothetical protein O2890_14740 [Cyanobacteria bacterium]|nr:hypothetical protein [Cyanobacteriota bacterium]MDA0867627.1 hypothetical protein [Cyanobacteriota bacterium]
MDAITVLPNVDLRPNGPMAERFLQAGLTTFHDACHWVKALPYGANTHSEDSLILFEEGYGNCTTKHGAIARLAQAHGLPVHKHLGFYRLNDDIVTGVNAMLAPHGLDFIPQIHCFLVYEDYRVDLTEGNCNGKNQTIEDYDVVVPVAPDLTRAQHHAYYRQGLQQYYPLVPQLAALGEAIICELLAECDRQLKYQCSIMVDTLTPVGG